MEKQNTEQCVLSAVTYTKKGGFLVHFAFRNILLIYNILYYKYSIIIYYKYNVFIINTLLSFINIL